MLNKPSCFDSRDQYLAWWALIRDSVRTNGKKVPLIHFCQDCTLAYQHKMVEEKRCEYPGTIFNGDTITTPKLEKNWIEKYDSIQESLEDYRGTQLYVGTLSSDVIKTGRIGKECQIEGVPFAIHPRCKNCGILAGPNHYEAFLIGDSCRSCYYNNIEVT